MKSNTRRLLFLGAVIAAVVAIAGFFIYRNMYRVEPGAWLDQHYEFYNKHDAQTRAYLLRVYPLAAESLKNKTYVEVAEIYNSLDITYNCAYEYHGNLINKDGGWNALSCSKDPKNLMPYPPQGYFYFWPTYAEKNQHTEYSSGYGFGETEEEAPRSAWGSQRPNVPWGIKSDGGEISRLERSGPSPFWVFTYSFVRNMYYPFGPLYDESFSKWTVLNGINVDDVEGNMGFVNKKKNWAFGVPEGEYVEVAHSSWEPGMIQSQGFWMTPFYGGGTGLFYKIGRTLIARNKMHGLFKLINILATKSASELQMPDMTSLNGPDFSKMSGKEILMFWYKTTDPYEIVWKYCATNKEGEGIWPAMSRTSSGGTVVFPKQWIGIDNKGVLSASGLFNPGEIGENGNPYGPNGVVNFRELALWHAKIHGRQNNSMKEIIKDAIDHTISCKEYLMDRVCTIVAFDEPIFWLANVLGYETVQLTVSANANGLWSPEIIHTVVPDKKWAMNVKGRIYDFITGDDALSMFDISKGAPRYTMEGLFKWQQMISTVITQRDPFNLSYGRVCSEMGQQQNAISYNDKWFSAGKNCSKSTPATADCWKTDTNDYGFKTPQCVTNGQWGINVEGAATLPGKTFWGYHDEQKGCSPYYENIFCNNSLASEYSMLRIYTGADLSQ